MQPKANNLYYIASNVPAGFLSCDGKLVFMLERCQIEGGMAEEIASDLTGAFDRFCTPATWEGGRTQDAIPTTGTDWGRIPRHRGSTGSWLPGTFPSRPMATRPKLR